MTYAILFEMKEIALTIDQLNEGNSERASNRANGTCCNCI